VARWLLGLQAPPVTLDTRNAAARLGTAAIGNNGRAIVVWEQNNGVENTVYIANRSSSSEPWQAIENGRDRSFSTAYVARFTSEGATKIYVFASSGSLAGLYDRPAGTTGWTFIDSGGGFGSDYVDIARNGDVLAVDSLGNWASFDARTNSFVQRFTTATTGPGRILGVQTSFRAFGGTPLLAPNGVGAYLSVANFDVLPTPSQPAGDGRRTVDNLWGLFFKQRFPRTSVARAAEDRPRATGAVATANPVNAETLIGLDLKSEPKNVNQVAKSAPNEGPFSHVPRRWRARACSRHRAGRTDRLRQHAHVTVHGPQARR